MRYCLGAPTGAVQWQVLRCGAWTALRMLETIFYLAIVVLRPQDRRSRVAQLAACSHPV